MWIRACATTDVVPGEAITVPADPPIALFNVDGEFLATGELCSHDRSPLSDGYIDGDVVECAWHFAKFCLRTGAALSLPATSGVATYPTKVEAGEVRIDV